MTAASFSRFLDQASLLVTTFGLGVGALVLARTGRLIVSLTVFMDMLTAAGLLRLAAAPTLTRALAAGGVLLVRRLATLGLHGRDPLGPNCRGPAGRDAAAARRGLGKAGGGRSPAPRVMELVSPGGHRSSAGPGRGGTGRSGSPFRINRCAPEDGHRGGSCRAGDGVAVPRASARRSWCWSNTRVRRRLLTGTCFWASGRSRRGLAVPSRDRAPPRPPRPSPRGCPVCGSLPQCSPSH